MTILSRRLVTPYPGKSETAIERLRIGAGVIERAGGDSLLVRITYGHMAGSIALFGIFPDFLAATAASEKMAVDREMQDLRRQREEDPAGEFQGPTVLRMVYGEPEIKPVMLVRTYQVDRENLNDAVNILAKVGEFAKRENGGIVTGLVPMISDNMDSLNAVYGFDNREHFAQAVTNVGLSQEFQDLVAEAATKGKLRSSRVQEII